MTEVIDNRPKIVSVKEKPIEEKAPPTEDDHEFVLKREIKEKH